MTTPFVRLVVVNYNGGDLTLACLDSLAALDWPAAGREVWLVDNASTDGVVERLAAQGDVKVVRKRANIGFGAACNVAMEDLSGVDYVALVNNDAVVDRRWLHFLVEALEHDLGAGAANGKVLLEPVFAEVVLESETFVPGKGDRRRLGVRVSGVLVDGVDVSDGVEFGRGMWGPERGDGDEKSFRWTNQRAGLLVPAPAGQQRSRRCQLRLATAGSRRVTIVTAAGRAEHVVDGTPRWYDAPPLEGWTDVIDSAGVDLLAGGHGPDRGFLEPDLGQYEEPAEVFACTASAVLLATRYLADVGLFDARLFLYYEDFDLSWRARLLGWRHRYVPAAAARHVHSAATSKVPEQVLYHLERNRLVVVTKNAPLSMLVRVLADFAAVTVRSAAGEAWNSWRTGNGLSTGVLRQRCQVLAGYLRLLPGTVARRRALRKRRRVDDREILGWELRRPG